MKHATTLYTSAQDEVDAEFGPMFLIRWERGDLPLADLNRAISLKPELPWHSLLGVPTYVDLPRSA